MTEFHHIECELQPHHNMYKHDAAAVTCIPLITITSVEVRVDYPLGVFSGDADYHKHWADLVAFKISASLRSHTDSRAMP